MITQAVMKAKTKEDPAFVAAWAKAANDRTVIDAMIQARAEAGLTQEALAERMRTTQSAVARLEGGRVSPTVDTLRKYAKAVGKKLRVEMI